MKHGTYQAALVIMGARASGKSTLGRRAAQELSRPYVSFGEHIRRYAIAQGLEAKPHLLENVGSRLVQEKGYAGLLADVIDAYGASPEKIVLDGVRHPRMLEVVNQAFSYILSIYIEVPYNLRYERWLRREGLKRSQETLHYFRQLSTGAIERHVHELRRYASHVVDGSQPSDMILSVIMDLLAKIEW